MSLRYVNFRYYKKFLYDLFIFVQFKGMLYFITILIVFMVAYGVATNTLLRPWKASISKFTDINIQYSYFNIHGELFIGDDAEGKSKCHI